MKNLIILLFLAGCGSKVITPPTPTPIPSEPTTIAIEDGYPKEAFMLVESEWREYTHIKKFFKNECHLQAFMKSLAYMESGYNLKTRFKEPAINGKVRNDFVTGSRIYSEGLFQMSYQDAKLWGCGFEYLADKQMSDKTIFMPAVQADCALKVLNRMIAAEKTPYYNRSSVIANYWYPLKPRNTSKHLKFRNLYKKNKSEMCR